MNIALVKNKNIKLGPVGIVRFINTRLTKIVYGKRREEEEEEGTDRNNVY